jgi:opacity protein-like surface antigen
MRKLITTSSAALLALGLATGAQAQQYHPLLPTTGTSEVDFAADINFEPIESQSVAARYGYFFNRNFQLGVEGSYDRLENDDSISFWTIGLFGNFNFPTATPWLPYVGGFVGMVDGEEIDNEVAYGAQAGAKYFFNPNVAGFAELRYRCLEDCDNDSSGLFFGLSVFFR